MAEVVLTRVFAADQQMVFEVMTQPEGLHSWWGPEGMTLPDAVLDFTRKGPWHSVFQNAEGQRFKVSGHVTHVDPPNSVGITWAWHDEKDARGPESHVTFSLRPATGGGTEFTLTHVELVGESAAGHEQGWISTLRKLEQKFA